MYELYSTKEKIYMLICGLIIALGIVYTTYIYFETRAINNEWHQTFTTPKEFWSKVPKWEWRPVIENHLEGGKIQS